MTRGVNDDAGSLNGSLDLQESFSHPDQSIVIFGWDDTLYPTHWLRRHNLLHWKRGEEVEHISRERLTQFDLLLDHLETQVLAVLKEAARCAHVVIVALGPRSWLTTSFENFPRVSALIKAQHVEFVFANDIIDGREMDAVPDIDVMQWRAQKYQGAILEAISHFYAKSNSSWKNVISIGDSTLQRYSAQASCLDYATINDDDSSTHTQPELGIATKKVPILTVRKSKDALDNFTLSGWVGKHYRRLRCKTVKMFSTPSAQDLLLQMTIILRWLPLLVIRDAGLDVDMEDEHIVTKVHNELLAKAHETDLGLSQKPARSMRKDACSPRKRKPYFQRVNL